MTTQQVNSDYKPACFNPECNSKPRFRDWAGWQWCFTHWIGQIKYQDYKWFYFKTTEIL